MMSSRFLHKLTKDPRKVMALDLSEGRARGSTRTNPSVKEHLIGQFRRLYRDVDSASLRNSLPKILAEMEVLSLKVIHIFVVSIFICLYVYLAHDVCFVVT